MVMKYQKAMNPLFGANLAGPNFSARDVDERLDLKTNQVYEMDCFDFLGRVSNTSIDLAIVDPPYNMHKASWDSFTSEQDFFNFTFKWIDALIPKLKETGSLYIFNTPYNSAFILSYLVNKRMIFQNWITWDKRDGMGGAKRRYSNGQETVLFFTKSDNHFFNYNDIRLPYDSIARIEHAKGKGILKNGKRWFPNPGGKLCGEVWHITSERHKHKENGKTPKLVHLTPKPLEMIERIVRASSNPGDLVLDCFVGSGTTAVAAKKLGRNFLCCDADKKYVELAHKILALYDN
ncbi:MAG: Modification methylase MboII [Parcubacteria group bacterium GW2011_GWA2_42_28]|nr:MAG: Modification methylase MboII [Parcubacteria group bacterium GW2011_GWA2_42_28]